jgi:nicotinamide-nucleotide amidase
MSERQIEILTVGDELLRGEVIDTNSAWLGERIGELGLCVARATSVGDGREALVSQVRECASRSDALIVSGGLGPTDDDRTTAAVAEVAGVSLEKDEAELEGIRARLASVGLTFTENNAKQAHFPCGATVLPNPWGTAPGFTLAIGRCRVICLPGPPRELHAIFHASVAPMLSRELGGRPAVTRRFKAFGLAEAQVDQRLAGLSSAVEAGDCSLTVHYRATFPEIHVLVVIAPRGEGASAERLEAVAAEVETEVRARLGHSVFAKGDETFSDALVRELRRGRATLALAESCTGGMAGELITRAPGSSEVFLLSAVTYSNEAKERVLGVPAELLAEHGAVSQACVEAMAKGARSLVGATYGVAISGIAGPGGGTDDKPVGTVHFALDGPRGTRHLHRVFGYDRHRVRVVSAHVAHWLVYRDLTIGASASAEPLGGRWAPKSKR